MLVGITTSLLILLLFLWDSQTFVSTRFILSCTAAADIGYLSFLLIFCLFQVIESIECPIVLALLYCAFNIFEIFCNWLLTVMSLERVPFFLNPSNLKFSGTSITYVLL